MKLIFLGPPGAGKGTQAVKIAQELGIAHISTGDMLRSQIREGTQLGKAAKAIIDQGGLVPDDVIIHMVEERICQADCKNGFLFDGFPRTVAQADALAGICKIDRAVDIDVPDQKLVSRISGRRMCPACGKAYHTSTYGSDTCECGEKLYQRDDDREETVKNRLAVYHTSTQPLIEYYDERALLSTVNGDQAVDAVTAEIRKALGL